MLPSNPSACDIAARLARQDVDNVADSLVTAVRLATEGMDEKELGYWFRDARDAADPCFRAVLGMEYSEPSRYPLTIWVRKPFIEGLFGLVREDDAKSAPRADAHINASVDNLRFYWLQCAKWCITRRLCARAGLAVIPPDPEAWALDVVDLAKPKVVFLCNFYGRGDDAQSWLSDFCTMVCVLCARLADENALEVQRESGADHLASVKKRSFADDSELMEKLYTSPTLSRAEAGVLLKLKRTALQGRINDGKLTMTSKGRVTCASLKKFLHLPANRPRNS